MGKGMVWGYKNRRHEVKYTKHQIGSRSVYVKIPKVFNIQRLILARHLMFMDQPGVYFEMMKNPIGHVKNVDKMRKLSLSQRIPSCCRCKVTQLGPRKLRENVKNLPTTNAQGRFYSAVEFNFDDLGYKKYKKNLKLMQTIKDRQKSLVLNIRSDTATCGWENRNWQIRACQDVTSKVMNEIVINSRTNLHENSGLVRHHQSTILILLESARLAFMRHDWEMTLRYLISLIRTYPLHPMKVMRSIIWNLGLLVIVNHGKNSMERLKEFATTLKPLLKDEPTWVSVQLGIWFIQKGHFVDGFSFIDDSVSNLSLFHSTMWNHKSVINPKLDLTAFIVELVQAVRLYYVWKQSLISNQDGIEADDTMEIADDEQEQQSTRYGGYALNAFESVHRLSTVVEADVMCFLEPLIELYMKYRSLDDAKRVICKIYADNYGNSFVEKFYLKFMEKNFSNECSSNLFKFQKQRLEQNMDFQTERNWKNSKSKFDRLRALRKSSGMRDQLKFVQILNPGFSS